MERMETIAGIAKEIYSLYSRAQWNKKQCRRLVERIKILMVPVEFLHKQPQINKDIGKVLEELSQILENAKSLVDKYCSRGWWKKLFWAFSIHENFEQINQRLSDAGQGLALALHAEERERFLKMFEEAKWIKQDKKDAEADLAALKKYFEEGIDSISDQVDIVHQDVKHMDDKVQQMGDNVEEILKFLEKQFNSSALDTTNIKQEELKKQEKLLETGKSILYRGEYYKSVVAIKEFKNPSFTDVALAKKIFLREVQTMKKFEHPGVLRMYGICTDNTGALPSFSIVMEYCERGTLREVLKKEQGLTWETRIKMSQGTALGLYRLHQTTEKSVIHGSITSSNFLVDSRYFVKLAGFELSRTESSFKRASNDDKQKEVHDSAYLSPQALGNINFTQDKPSDIYSLGIVLWEIAAQSTPFKGLTTKEIFQKVTQEQYKEPLPEDCPEDLQVLIQQCRDYAPEARPSAGVVADKLMGILIKEMEKDP